MPHCNFVALLRSANQKHPYLHHTSVANICLVIAFRFFSCSNAYDLIRGRRTAATIKSMWMASPVLLPTSHHRPQENVWSPRCSNMLRQVSICSKPQCLFPNTHCYNADVNSPCSTHLKSHDKTTFHGAQRLLVHSLLRPGFAQLLQSAYLTSDIQLGTDAHPHSCSKHALPSSFHLSWVWWYRFAFSPLVCIWSKPAAAIKSMWMMSPVLPQKDMWSPSCTILQRQAGICCKIKSCLCPWQLPASLLRKLSGSVIVKMFLCRCNPGGCNSCASGMVQIFHHDQSSSTTAQQPRFFPFCPPRYHLTTKLTSQVAYC